MGRRGDGGVRGREEWGGADGGSRWVRRGQGGGAAALGDRCGGRRRDRGLGDGWGRDGAGVACYAASPVPAPAPLRWFEAAGVAILAVLGSWAVQLVAASARMLRGGTFAEAAGEVARDPLSLGLAQLLGFGVAIAVGRRLGRGEPARAEGAPRLPWTADLGLLPAPRLALALAVLAGLALQLPLSEIGNAVHELTPRDLAHERAVRELLDVGSPLEGFAVVGAFVLVAPLMEELLFRGLLLPRLVRAHGVPAGLVVSAALFALVHGRPAPMAYALAAGLVLGALRLRFRSVVPCVALHAATNAVPVLVPPELLRLPGVNVVSEELLHVPLAWLLPAIAVAGAALALLARVPDVE